MTSGGQVARDEGMTHGVDGTTLTIDGVVIEDHVVEAILVEGLQTRDRLVDGRANRVRHARHSLLDGVQIVRQLGFVA